MKLKLTIAGKTVELTLEEARELYAELGSVFGEKEVAPQPIYIPFPFFQQPLPQLPLPWELPTVPTYEPEITWRSVA